MTVEYSIHHWTCVLGRVEEGFNQRISTRTLLPDGAADQGCRHGL